MRFLNPKTDFAFKKIFGSEQSKDILISFVNAILELHPPNQIVDLTILDPYLAPKIKGMKDTYLDIKAKDEQGRSLIIEMQVLNVAGFEKRVLYNACKAYSGQITKGNEYSLLSDVIAITLTDFEMFPELPNIINKFKLRSETAEIYANDLELVFAELPKFRLEIDQLQTILDKWFYFLKFAGDLQAVPENLRTEPAIVHAFDLANKAGMTEMELDAQEHREIFIQDQRGSISLALKKGEIIGIEKGEKIGIEKGEKIGIEKGEKIGIEKGEKIGIEKGEKIGIEIGMRKKAYKIATSLLPFMNDETIALNTELPLEEVQKLRQEHATS